MNPEYKLYEEIDRYLRLEMHPEELQAFEGRLLLNQEMQEVLEAQKLTNELIIDRELVHLKNRMQKEMSNSNGTNRWTKTVLVSSALIVASGALFVLIDQHTTEPKKESATVTEKISGEEVSPKEIIVKENNQVVKKSTSIHQSPATVSLSPVENKEEVPVNSSKENISPIVTETKQENNPVEPIKTVNEPHTVNCAEVTIQADAKVVYGFQDEAPRIVVNQRSVKGGVAPYAYSLDNKTYTSSAEFEDLKDGNYTLYVRDQHQCMSTIKKTLTVKKPVEEIDESFSPAYGNAWNFPLKNNTDGTITILNKAGSMVYQTRISGGYPNTWDGRDNEGRELESGNYIFIINFVNNESVKGHVTIVR